MAIFQFITYIRRSIQLSIFNYLRKSERSRPFCSLSSPNKQSKEQDKMPSVFSQICTEQPNKSNVIPYKIFESTQPRQSGMNNLMSSNQPVLLAGGRNLYLRSVNITQVVQVELYILHQCILLWLPSLGQGIQIPYQNVIYHGIRRLNDAPEGHRLELLLTIEMDQLLEELFFSKSENGTGIPNSSISSNNTLQTIELIFKPKYSLYERVYNEGEEESLFTFVNFGVNRGDEQIENINQGLIRCLELQMNSRIDDSENEQEYNEMETMSNAMFVGMGETLRNYDGLYPNDGNADDLNGDMYTSENNLSAGMAVEFANYSSSLGKRSQRD